MNRPIVRNWNGDVLISLGTLFYVKIHSGKKVIKEETLISFKKSRIYAVKSKIRTFEIK